MAAWRRIIHPTSIFGLGRQSKRCYSTKATARTELLKKIYHPFSKLVKDSPKYHELSHSGRVWEEHFKPYDAQPYLEAQTKLQGILSQIDEKKSSKFLRWRQIITRSMVVDHAHQSCAIELNPLSREGASAIAKGLELHVFRNIEFAKISWEQMAKLSLPSPKQFLPGKNPDHLAELRNHILISHYFTERNLANTATPLSLQTIQLLSRSMLIGTSAEALYQNSWGSRVALGDFRTTTIRVQSNPLRIFPYPQEVPACMDRFMRWWERAERLHGEKGGGLHPLVKATQGFVYFVSVHPFLDGNGRVGRSIMLNFMLRCGYLPTVFKNLERGEYLRMVSDASDGMPRNLCEKVLEAQLEDWGRGGDRKFP